jgi:gliding motility-associated-like protein
MRHFLLLLSFLVSCLLEAQTTELNNSGDLFVHPEGTLGIHTNIFNDGAFFADTNSLIGFYGDVPNIVEGNLPLSVYDVEFGNSVGTFLRTRMEVANNANFIASNVITAQNLESNALVFEPLAFYTGDSDDGKVIGYAGMVGQAEFTFPVGDRDQLRPLILNSSASDVLSLCTYIREDPSNPQAIDETFDTESKTRDVGEISASEFWVLKHEEEATVTLSWNSRSNLVDLAPDLSEIILVGWSISANQWIPLSGTNGIGTITEGIITSDSFIPNRYAAITFAGIPLERDTFAVNNPTLGNYFITPNGDGTNDFLVFDNLEETGSNQLYIYNKFGQKVFEMSNYNNEFGGVSNINNAVIKRDIGLPEGIYYYIIDLIDENLQYQGFFFLDR